VWEAGQAHGIAPAGIGVYGTTGRLEKCYRAFGFELDADYDVVEAGMAWGRVKTPDFIGKEAHVKHREQDPVTVLCTLTVDDHTSKDGTNRYMLGKEPVLSRDGKPLVDAHGRRAYVTSAGTGPSIGKHILLSYLPPEHANVGEELLVEYLGEQYPVTVATNDSTPVFDAENSRVKA
jgi:glycine cleavage system aminomethyltransferase T